MTHARWLVVPLLVAGSAVPSHAAETEVVACQGAVTEYQRSFTWAVTGTGPATCALAGTAPVTGTVTVYVSAVEPGCGLMGATFVVTIGGHEYWFAYQGAGASRNGAGVQLSSGKDGQASLTPSPLGWMAWTDTAEVVCPLVEGSVPTGTTMLQYAFTGHYLRA